MAQQLHGLPPNIDILPDEVLDRIVELLIAHDRPGAENLALTNRRLQAKIYRFLYPVLTVQSTNLDRLARLGRPKYQYSKEIVFEYELPRYDCNECYTRMPHSEVETHSKKFRSVLTEFFAAIVFYDPRSWAQARLTLDLFCPSDHQHWRLRHRSRFPSSETLAQVRNLGYELDIFAATYDIGHRFAQLGSSPDVNGLLRPFTMTTQPHPSELLFLENQVLKDPTLFQELYITRQMCRQIDPKTMIFLLKCMPMLRKFHYEKWKTPGDEPDLCLEMLNAAIQLPDLQTLIIYEELCPRLRQALEEQKSSRTNGVPNDSPGVLPVSSALPSIPQTVLSVSRSIRILSVSRYVDGCIFFKSLRATNHCWPALRMLTLTMKDFTKDPNNRQRISHIITNAALLLPNLPSLNIMRLYNDSLDNACILTCADYGPGACGRRPRVTWKSTWEFTFSHEEKQQWNDAAADRRGGNMMPAFFEYPLHLESNATHMQVLSSLRVDRSVMGGRSQVVKRYEDNIFKREESARVGSQNDS